MAKTFTDKPLHQFDQVKTDNITTNLDKYLDEVNGGLDANNLPVLSIDETKLKEPTIPQPGTSGLISKDSAAFPSQAYYFTKRRTVEEGSNTIWEPILSVDLDQDTWSAGFNKLADLDSNWQNFPLQFEAREGMLVGCAVIDWEHGNNVFNVDDGGGNIVPRGRGNDWWTEWAVYVNNILVVRSGFIYPRRHTTQLPFAVACGSQPVQIDCRVKINTWRASGSPSSATTSTDFKVFSAQIWTRNHYR